MEAPIQFYRKNARLEPGPGIPAWPFRLNEDNGEPFAGVSDIPELAHMVPYWVGDWQTPPPEVCDILTASEWRIQFQFDGSEIGGLYSDIPSVSIDTTILPGQVKRKTELDGEYVVGGDGYQSFLDILNWSFEPSDEYNDSLANGEFFRLQYEWTSPVFDDGEPVEGSHSLVQLTIRLYGPQIQKNEEDKWVWFFFTQSGSVASLASYSVTLVENGIEQTSQAGDVINFMGNQHSDPVAGFPVVSLSIESHF